MDQEQAVARADELGLFISGNSERVDAALPELLSLLRNAASAEALEAAIIALSHAYDERAVIALLDVAAHDQSDPRVRRALASGLAGPVKSAEVRDRVVAMLVRLTADMNGDVRDWACFSLGVLEASGDDVREALAARLDDEHLNARCEALVALARLGDPRVLPAAVANLAGDGHVNLLQLETAATLSYAAQLPELHRLADAWAGDDDEHNQAVALAIRRCSPEAHEQAARCEQVVAAQANALLNSTPITISLEGNYPITIARVHCTAGAPPQQESARLWLFAEDEPAIFDAAATAASWASWARAMCDATPQS